MSICHGRPRSHGKIDGCQLTPQVIIEYSIFHLKEAG